MACTSGSESTEYVAFRLMRGLCEVVDAYFEAMDKSQSEFLGTGYGNKSPRRKTVTFRRPTTGSLPRPTEHW